MNYYLDKFLVIFAQDLTHWIIIHLEWEVDNIADGKIMFQINDPSVVADNLSFCWNQICISINKPVYIYLYLKNNNTYIIICLNSFFYTRHIAIQHISLNH